MESRFGYDFGKVRVHTGSRAEASAKALDARAYTLGADVVFGADAYSPGTASGRWLLAHELAHVVQQRSGAVTPLVQRQPVEDDDGRGAAAGRSEKNVAVGPATEESSTDETLAIERDEDKLAALPQTKLISPRSADALERQADAAAAAVATGGRAPALTYLRRPTVQLSQGQICGRDSTQFPDFPETYIHRIDVDLASPNHDVTLTWTGPSAGRGETGPFDSSPGAGKCARDCNDESDSRADGSNCTPKGTRTVERYACALGSDARATNATYFHAKRGIAFHYFPSVPNYPASHGCVRLGLHAAQLIYDNSRAGRTTVDVSGTWTRGRRGGRPVCY